MMADAPKRQRAKNLSTFEINLLLDLLTESRLSIIECKNTDAISINTKKRTWQAVLDAFHAEGGDASRDVKTLQNVWKRLKEQSKKAVGEEKRELRKTGGGISEAKTLTNEMNRVLGMLRPEQLHPPLQSLYDCDSESTQAEKQRLNDDIDESFISDDVRLRTVDVMELAVNIGMSQSQVPHDDEDVDVEPTVEIKEPPKRPKPSKMSAYHKELLSMARTEHLLMVDNLKLKNEILKKKLKLLSDSSN